MRPKEHILRFIAEVTIISRAKFLTQFDAYAEDGLLEPDRAGPHDRWADHDNAPVGAYNDIVKAAEAKGIPVATTNSLDGTILDRSGISHTGQDASAAAIAGEALVKCLADKGIEKGSIVLPSSTAMGNIEVNNRVTSAFNAVVRAH